MSNNLKADATNAPKSENGSGAEDGNERKKRRKSRWGDDKVNIPGLVTALPSGMTTFEQDTYLLHLRLEEINRKLRTGEVVPPENERSPSPEPQYDREGNRVNTREKRYRRKVEEERFKLIEEAIKKDPTFKPPPDYKKPTKFKEKIYIPQKNFTEVNFIGQLIGPRGNTLKKMERETGVKIFIRGKGSIKEGKKDMGYHPDDDDELHCLVTADSEEKVRNGVAAVLEVIEIAKSIPEELNDRKRLQLRELAALNGTLRDDETVTCHNCGAQGHRDKDCPERKNFTTNLVCPMCGSGGHLARDCYLNFNAEARQTHIQQATAMDQEYLSLMKELGEENAGGLPGSSFAAIQSTGKTLPAPPGVQWPVGVPVNGATSLLGPQPGQPGAQPTGLPAAPTAWPQAPQAGSWQQPVAWPQQGQPAPPTWPQQSQQQLNGSNQWPAGQQSAQQQPSADLQAQWAQYYAAMGYSYPGSTSQTYPYAYDAGAYAAWGQTAAAANPPPPPSTPPK